MQHSSLRANWNLFRRAVCFACPLCALMTFSQTSQGAFVLALAGGQLPSLAQQGSDSSDTSASVSIAIERTGVNGTWKASATAGYGQLGATAELSGSNVAASFGNAQASSRAQFGDIWTLTDEPLDTVGQLRISIHFDGAASQAPGVSAIVTSLGGLNVSLNALSENGNIFGSTGIFSGEIFGAVDITYVSDPLSFRYGRPIKVGGTVAAFVQMSPLANFAAFSGSGSAEFGSTASFTRLEVLDTNGNWTTDFSLNTETGARYPFEPQDPAPIPVPSSLALSSILFGMLGLVGAYKRRKQTATTVWRSGEP